jgi:hypothetical protein
VKPTIYLAGAIRDGRVEDIEWRARVIDALSGRAKCLNPVAGKVWDGKGWTVSGIPSTGPVIYRHDLWCIRQADIVLGNLTALREGYPCIGTLVEIGYAVALGKLIYLIHSAGPLVHPFLSESAAVVFQTEASAIAFLRRHLESLFGRERTDGEAD